MGFGLKSLFEHSVQLLTVAPRLVPEVLQQPSVRNPVAVSLGAIAGALSRYYLSLWFAQHFGTSFPYGTLFINISGCLAMGFFFTLALERVAIISPELRLLVAVGFLGAYTTFSTYALDTVNLLNNQNFIPAGFYLVSSVILGIISIQLGMILARLWY
ncbi:fluoride efflux transporter CrcB [Anabaena sp. UHCC 0399]|uniref:fluoride efflux transporter CrcB n=1 Tax=Anabaena sp. UHCC 0399 TaxID=3110238 RepID=UPI002B2013AE|nr:fluoride efflux transporter CrcB [Anabaena sp. UHCC 0399]MEA5567887.1 fluoride efflux transporter CrcB [Anabaena sp. UHCC 0399]